MRNRHVSVILGAALSAAIGACGGAQPETGISIGFRAAALELVQNVKAVRIVFHSGSRTCDAVKPRPDAVGIHSVDLDLTADEQSAGGSVQVEEIPADSYTVVAYGADSAAAFDASPHGALGFDCKTGQKIEDGKRASISLKLSPY